MKNQYIANLHEGDEVNDYFIITRKDLRDQPSGDKFLGFVIRDKTGEMGGVLWEKPVEIAQRIEVGDVVVVKGTIRVYKDRLQIRATNIIPLADEQYSKDDLILPEMPNTDNYIKELWTIIDSIKDPWLKKLVQSFCNDQKLMSAFESAPAAKKWHHELRGGLFRHCYELIKLAQAVCELYPKVNKDLLITACFLHDIGKVHELSIDQLYIDYTDAGRLIGHIVEGALIVSEKIKTIDGFPEDLRLHLLHCILSHHGEYENGSPVLPKTLEAMILHHLDDLDAQTNALTRIEQDTLKKGDKWSEFITLISRQIWTKRL
ncbi:MAG TPA: HD domain-containing protein [Candidatus Hydrogenedens sp.]|nr:HD domain-containing protein [Candidatus Hydrogenedens sp.]